MFKNSRMVKLIILICSIVFFIVCFIPLQQGIIGVYQVIVGNVFGLIVVVTLMVGFMNEIFIKRRRHKGDVLCMVALVVSLTFCMYKLTISVMGIIDGIQIVQCEEYKVERNKTKNPQNKYVIKFQSCEIQNSVFITEEQYYRLKGCDNKIKVIYYPYVDIAEEVIIIE